MSPSEPEPTTEARTLAALERVEAVLPRLESLAKLTRKVWTTRLMVLGLAVLFLFGGVTYRSGRLDDCHRSNDNRADLRAAFARVLEPFARTADGRAFIRETNRALAHDFPPREC